MPLLCLLSVAGRHQMVMRTTSLIFQVRCGSNAPVCATLRRERADTLLPNEWALPFTLTAMNDKICRRGVDKWRSESFNVSPISYCIAEVFGITFIAPQLQDNISRGWNRRSRPWYAGYAMESAYHCGSSDHKKITAPARSPGGQRNQKNATRNFQGHVESTELHHEGWAMMACTGHHEIETERQSKRAKQWPSIRENMSGL